jgi:hypothetical protein
VAASTSPPGRFRRIAMVWLAVLAAAPHFHSLLYAQTVVGHVLDGETAAPVEGALVLLLDPSRGEVGGALSGFSGRFVIRAPGPGAYTLRVERIGYGTTTSGPFTLQVGQTFQTVLQILTKPLEIEGFRVEAERRCRVRPGEGLLLSYLWEEASKALRNQDWSAQEGLIQFVVVGYEREMDPSLGLILAEAWEPRKTVTGNPIRSLPTEDLLEGGYIRAEDDGYRYFAPDAGTLLSDRFLDTHCFRLEDGPAPPGLVGLSFEPAGGGPAREIAGTLWLDETDARPRFLNFHYTSAPWPEAQGVAAGRVEFEELPGGIWIVKRWWIRMPKMVRDWSAMMGGRSGLRVGSIVEAGGEVVGTTLGRKADASPESPVGEVSGVVRDSIAGRHLEGAQVFLDGTPYFAQSDSAGFFVMENVPEGTYRLTFHHPRLDAIGAYPLPREVRVSPGETSQVEVAGPGRAALLVALCPESVLAEGASAVVGIVRTGAGGDPVKGAAVRLEWTDYRPGGGGGIRSDVQALEVTSDLRGRFRACGIPPGVLLAAQASAGGARGGIHREEVGRSSLVILDLNLDAADEAGPLGEAGPCGELEAGSAWGGIQGEVRDASTGTPMGKITVWLEAQEGGSPQSTVADAGGRFAFCGVEAGAYVLRTALRGMGEGRNTVSVRGGHLTDAGLDLRLHAEGQRTGTIRGRVVTEVGQPLPGAEIRLEDGLPRITGSDGTFHFPQVPAGSVTLRASFLGYGDAEGEVIVGGGQDLTVEMRLSPRPIEMEPLVVEAVRSRGAGMLADVELRSRSAWGTVLLGEVLERRMASVRSIVDVLHEHGAVISPSGQGVIFRRTGCAPHVYVDGVKVTRVPRGGNRFEQFRSSGAAREEAAQALNLVHPADVTALEIYRGPAEIPGEFLASDSQCGIILVWTKRGMGR